MNAVIQTHRGVLTVRLPIQTVSESNVRTHWSRRAARVKEQRGAVALALAQRLKGALFPVVVTLVRVAPRQLDDDNLRGALKACRDQVADALGLPNDRDPRVTWEYAQARGGRGEYRVDITVAPSSTASAPPPPREVIEAAPSRPASKCGVGR